MAPLWVTAAAAGPYLGVEWRPLSRADLTWVEEGRTSGLAVGSADGFARPQLGVYGGGWFTDHIGAHGALGVARVQTTTWEADVYEQRVWSVIRPSFDVRVSLLERSDRRPIPWVFLGGHVDLPTVIDRSNGYTADEAELAAASEEADRQLLGGIGGRVGAGADVALLPALRFGLQWALGVQQALRVDSDPTTVNTFVAAEGALLLELHWPTPGEE